MVLVAWFAMAGRQAVKPVKTLVKTAGTSEAVEWVRIEVA
jgi:hypothetical protein